MVYNCRGGYPFSLDKVNIVPSFSLIDGIGRTKFVSGINSGAPLPRGVLLMTLRVPHNVLLTVHGLTMANKRLLYDWY